MRQQTVKERTKDVAEFAARWMAFTCRVGSTGGA